MKALVTGANGFVGAHLCKYLSSKGVEVFAMVRKTSDLTLLQDLIPDLKNIKIIYGDLTNYKSLLENFIEKDVIFNVAGIVKGLTQESFDKVNVKGYINVANALLEVNPQIKRVIMTSSLACAGESKNGTILTEDMPIYYLENDKYGYSKWKMEKKMEPYMNKLPMVIIRPPVIIGQGDIPSLDLFKAPKFGFKLVIGSKYRYYSIIDIEDLCEGYYLCATKENAVGNIFYISNKKPIEWGSLQELIGNRLFRKKYGSLLSIAIPEKLLLLIGKILQWYGKLTHTVPFINESKVTNGIADGFVCSSEKAARLLGWKQRIPIKDALVKAGNWYIQHDLL